MTNWQKRDVALAELKPSVNGAGASLFAEQLLRMYVLFAIKWAGDITSAGGVLKS